jgi:hypothetical protein
MDMIIRITEDNRVFLETVGLTKTKKEVNFNQVASLFLNNIVPTTERSMALPYGTVHYCSQEKNGVIYSEKVVVMYQTVNRPFKYHKTTFASIPFPILLFKFIISSTTDTTENRLTDVKVKVGAITSTILKEKSIVYHYPYSNVYDNGTICFGSNVLPNIKKLTDLSAVPELFLSGIQNDDMYRNANNSGMVLRELLELLDGSEFDNSVLKPMCTYEDFINNLRGK